MHGLSMPDLPWESDRVQSMEVETYETQVWTCTCTYVFQ